MAGHGDPHKHGAKAGAGKRPRLMRLMAQRSLNSAVVHRVLALLADEHEDDEPETVYDGRAPSAQSLQREATSTVAGLFSKLRLPVKAGGGFTWDVALPQKLLPHLVEAAPAYARQFWRSWQAFPPSAARPWRAVLYHDEITVGNAVKTDNWRTMTAIYLAFLEYGSWLQDEQAWMPVGVIRAKQARENTTGGVSSVMRVLFRALFIDEGSLGAGIRVGGRMLYARFHRLIADDAAGKSTFNVKGSSGIRPCMNCRNVVLNQDDPLTMYDSSDSLVTLCCVDDRKFIPMENHEMKHSFDLLKELRPHLGVGDFQDLEKALGITYNPHGILADPELSGIVLPNKFARDPMHVILASGGTAQVEVYALMNNIPMERGGCAWRKLREHFSGWRSGRGGGKAPAYLLSPARKAATLKVCHYVGQAGECLALLPLLRHWVATELVPRSGATPATDSFFAHCRIVDLYMQAKCDGADEAWGEDFNDAVRTALQLHVAAFGEDLLKPKHNFLFHSSSQPLEDGVLLDCFSLERKHRMLKSKAEAVHNPAAFERSVLGCVVMCYCEEAGHEVEVLSKLWDAPPEVSAAMLSTARVCRRARVGGRRFHTGDFVSRAKLVACDVVAAHSHCYFTCPYPPQTTIPV